MIDAIEENLFGTLGSYTLFAVAIICIVLVALLFIGVEFRFALLILAPLIVGLSYMGSDWLPQWIVGLAWIIIIGYSIYIFSQFLRQGG
jgi:hypothetical protein